MTTQLEKAQALKSAIDEIVPVLSDSRAVLRCLLELERDGTLSDRDRRKLSDIGWVMRDLINLIEDFNPK